MDAASEITKLSVSGMTCTNCALGIKKTLENHGLEDVNVDFSDGEVVFRQTNKYNLKDVGEWIHKMGYKVIDDAEKQEINFLSKIENRFFICLIFTLPLFSAMFLPFAFLHNSIVQLCLCIPVMLIGFTYFFKSAWGSVKSGVLNMDVLIAMGSGAAFIYSLVGMILFFGTAKIHQYLFFDTAATIITLVLLGNLFEKRSVKKTTSAVQSLKKLQKTPARKIEGNKIIEIPANEVALDDILIVNEGDIIPVDAIVIWGDGRADESMITGESEEITKTLDSKVIGGTVLTEGSIKIKASAVGKESTLSNIIELVKNAKSKQPDIQQLGDKVSSIFVPTVIGIAVATFLIAFFVFNISLQQALMQSIAVLVISCPCAMGLATPTALMVGLGKAAKKGILIKGGDTIEQFANVKTIVFDKTGTLTTGKFTLSDIIIIDNHCIEQEVINLIFSAEKHSSHPIAKSIITTLQDKAENVKLENIKEMKGKGISFSDEKNNNNYFIGALKEKNLTKHTTDSLIALYNDEKVIAYFSLKDEIKKGVKESLSILKAKGITTILLSGDKKEKCDELAKAVGIEKVYSEQSPGDKLKIIDALRSSTNKLAMIGDGINDAPALSKADIGISMTTANQIAIESAEIILLGKKDFTHLIDALSVSRETLRTIKQNLFWALFYNVAAIPLAAFGFLNPMIGALAMAFSDVVVIGNSLRVGMKKI